MLRKGALYGQVFKVGKKLEQIGPILNNEILQQLKL